MSEFPIWLALGLWAVAVALRVHPGTHRWAPRGIAGGWAARYAGPSPAAVTRTPTLPVPRDGADADTPPPADVPLVSPGTPGPATRV
ncbi:hypothetical protein [Geodermatophilus sp. DSM 44513]|uniref:hypothetical protein n=1 Tax=Geodermatophilus sp. DSM 44513 TaxID=1528104 RepID=UPI00127B4DF6|nr:hypothetical protein [Geodermatophilus sp. DSM 44513]WNV73952.1 hypothetical protein RTG05_13245 [Geodermatophilus sp. DSM 44513]